MDPVGGLFLAVPEKFSDCSGCERRLSRRASNLFNCYSDCTLVI